MAHVAERPGHRSKEQHPPQIEPERGGIQVKSSKYLGRYYPAKFFHTLFDDEVVFDDARAMHDPVQRTVLANNVVYALSHRSLISHVHHAVLDPSATGLLLDGLDAFGLITSERRAARENDPGVHNAPCNLLH